MLQKSIQTDCYLSDYELEIAKACAGDGLAAVCIEKQNNRDLYYILTDHLGSIQYVTNDAGTVVEEYSFDAWGRLRNPQNWTYNNLQTPTLLTRGFTGHEHLYEIGLINMNGRMYDPVVGRFLSADPYIQMPEYSQNYNRYSYCLNNPLSYTDPSGEFWHLVIGAAIGGTFNLLMNLDNIDNFGEGLAYFGVGAVAGAFGAGVGMGVNVAIAGGSFGAGFVGTATVSSTGFIAGAATGASTGVTNGLIQGTGNGMLIGKNFGDAFVQGGLDQALKQGLIGVVTGGVLGGIHATNNGRDFWTGSYKQFDMEPALLASTDNVVSDSYIFPDDATVVNADSYKVYYKSENGVTGIKDNVSPCKYIKSPVDGVATSKYANQVFKIPDGGKVLVGMGGSVEFTNGYGFYEGLQLVNRAGWQNAQYFIDRGAYEGWKSLFNAANLWIK